MAWYSESGFYPSLLQGFGIQTLKMFLFQSSTEVYQASKYGAVSLRRHFPPSTCAWGLNLLRRECHLFQFLGMVSLENVYTAWWSLGRGELRHRELGWHVCPSVTYIETNLFRGNKPVEQGNTVHHSCGITRSTECELTVTYCEEANFLMCA